MSRVNLIAAGKALPTGEAGMVMPYKYYRDSAYDLGLDIKPFIQAVF